jgi:hypothetical protein
MMMHGVASTNTAPTTTTTTNSTNMLQQDGSVVSTTSVTTTAQTGFKQDSINFSIKLKDPQSSMSLFSDAHQRKLEMLESRFVPLNPQKVYAQ